MARLPGCASNRRASWSGHRVLAFNVDCVPSVSDSPMATIAPVCFDARISTPASQNRACVVEFTGKTALPEKSPGIEMKEVCRPSKCQLAGPVFPGTNMLTATSLWLGTSSSTGSLTTKAPGGMVTPGLPPKVNVLLDPGTIDAVEPSAMCAAPTTRALDPNVDS